MVENFKKAEIPLDTMWNDIDYMENYLDFTTDSENYPEEELASFVEELHAHGQHYVLILDPGMGTGYGTNQGLILTCAHVHYVCSSS